MWTALPLQVAAFAEHTKRIWSVDFSATDPQRFLSGSDDGTVRLWSINDQVHILQSRLERCKGHPL